MTRTLTGFGVVRSRGLFATQPDVVHIVEGTFHLTSEGERNPVDNIALPEDVWVFDGAYPQNHIYVEDEDLILPTMAEAEAARLIYIRQALSDAQSEASDALQLAQRMAENLTRTPVVSAGP
jgi:hypothetical protein